MIGRFFLENNIGSAEGSFRTAGAWHFNGVCDKGQAP